MRKIIMFETSGGHKFSSLKAARGDLENKAMNLVTELAHRTAGHKYVENFDYLRSKETREIMRKLVALMAEAEAELEEDNEE
jgi:hypothetical protein